MSDSEVVNIASHMSALPDLALTADQMETIRLIVHGNSVIDWNRSSFRTVEDVNRFLRLHMLDPDDPHVRRGALGEGHGVRIVPTRYAGPGHGGASCNVAAPHPLLPGGSACALPSPDPRAVVAHVNSLAWLVTF